MPTDNYIEITDKNRLQRKIRIRTQNYSYTVEHQDIDADDGGCTISYQNYCNDEGKISITIHREVEALALADAIYKLFGKPKSTEEI
jgi:hypothetical protein